MKKILTFMSLIIILFTTSSCSNDSNIVVSSMITDKYEDEYIQTIWNGKFTTTIKHTKYCFVFNEVKPYVKTVNKSDYDKFNINDIYTFYISDNEKQYFFEDSITKLE